MELALETKLSKKPVLEANDPIALTSEQQDKLDEHKIKTRIENEQYLRKHPEVSAMLSSFISEVLRRRPDDIREFAASYFCDPTLPEGITKQLEERFSNRT